MTKKPPAVSEPGAAAYVPTVSASVFKATCLAWLDRVLEGDQVIITKRGLPVARLVPVTDPAATLVGSMRGTVTGWTDLVSPVDEPWAADG